MSQLKKEWKVQIMNLNTSKLKDFTARQCIRRNKNLVKRTKRLRSVVLEIQVSAQLQDPHPHGTFKKVPHPDCKLKKVTILQHVFKTLHGKYSPLTMSQIIQAHGMKRKQNRHNRVVCGDRFIIVVKLLTQISVKISVTRS